jgi:hypothetical protein
MQNSEFRVQSSSSSSDKSGVSEMVNGSACNGMEISFDNQYGILIYYTLSFNQSFP